MRKLMLSMLAMGVFVTVNIAQNPNLTKSAATSKQVAPAQGEQKMKPKTPDEWVNELDAVVDLSAEQKVKAKTFAENREKQMKTFREEMKNGGDKDAMAEKRKEFHKAQKAELAKILTPEQMTKWEAYRKAQHTEHADNRKPHTADDQVAQLDAVVGLTTDQKAKVKTLAETKQAKMKALREEQKANPNEAVYKEKREQIGKEFRTELDKVLTAEQKEKLKAHRKQMHDAKRAPVK